MGPMEEIMGMVRTTYKSKGLDTIFIEKLVEVMTKIQFKKIESSVWVCTMIYNVTS